MMYTYKQEKVTWIDLENPTQDEVRNLIDEYEIDPIVGEELLNPTHRSRVDLHKDYIYLILHFPTHFNPHKMNSKTEIQEVDFIIGKNFLITTRYNSIDALLEFSKIFEADVLLSKKHLTEHGGILFYHMIRGIYKSLYTKVEDIQTTLSFSEESVFKGKEKEMVFELSKINRVVLYFKEALLLHKEILTSFERAGETLFGKEFSFYLRAVLGEYYKVENTLQSTKDYLDELRRTNDSLLATKQGEIMKSLTIVSFITFPLTLISSIFGMNFESMPFVNSGNGFIAILILMTILGISMFIFFKYKKWISF